MTKSQQGKERWNKVTFNHPDLKLDKIEKKLKPPENRG